MTSAWEVSVKRRKADKGEGEEVDEEEEDVEDLWAGVVPEMGEEVVVSHSRRSFGLREGRKRGKGRREEKRGKRKRN